jgi:hypothetical protein
MTKRSLVILTLSLLLGCTTVFSQQNFYKSSDQILSLTFEQKLAVFWFNSLSDSSNIDSVLSISQIPFNWNDDTTFSTQNDFKTRINGLLTKVGRRPIIIDSVFDSPNGLKQFKNSDPSEIAVIEIWYYPTNSLRTHSMLIAINKQPSLKVVGFKFEGSLLRRTRY